jgi:hypothetical protein
MKNYPTHIDSSRYSGVTLVSVANYYDSDEDISVNWLFRSSTRPSVFDEFPRKRQEAEVDSEKPFEAVSSPQADLQGLQGMLTMRSTRRKPAPLPPSPRSE